MSSQHSTTEKNPQNEQASDTKHQVSPKIEDDVVEIKPSKVEPHQMLSSSEGMVTVPPSAKTSTVVDSSDRCALGHTSGLQSNSDESSTPTTINPEQSLADTQDKSPTLCPKTIKCLESMEARIRKDQQERMQGLREWLSMHTENGVREMKQGKDDTNSEKDQVSAITSQLGGLVRHLTRILEYAKLESQAVQLHNDLQTTADQNSQLKSHIKELRVKNKDLEARLKKVQIEFARSRRAGGPLANPSKTSDSIIQSEWKQLHFKISNLAHHLAKHPPSVSLEEDVRVVLRSVIFSYERHMACQGERALVLQGYLWRTIRPEDWFESKIWGTKHAADFKELRNTYTSASLQHEEGLKQTLQWFSQGWGLMGKWMRDPQATEKFVSHESKCLEPFIVERYKSARRVETDLREIFESAKILKDIFWSSKAIFKVTWSEFDQSPPLRFNDTCMDAIDAKPNISTNTKITYIVSPMLIKIGNADGNNYTSQIVLEKAKVVCE